MADRQFLRVNDKWALAYDSQQWVLQYYQGIDKRSGKEVWSGSAFVSTHKCILARVMHETSRCIPWEDAERALAKLPDTFREFIISPASYGLGSATDHLRVALSYEDYKTQCDRLEMKAHPERFRSWPWHKSEVLRHAA